MQIKDNIKFIFNAAYSQGTDDCQNILIHGDNKDVLSELLPEYANRIRCIYIDPPYNNGEIYHYYDDNSTQGNWLRDMRRVLNLLKPLLTKDGSIWISIDDSEMAYLRVEADKIFGRENFAGTIIWQQRKSRENRAVFSFNHEYILVYAKKIKEFKKKRNLLPVGEDFVNSKYKNPDNDPRGPWQSVTANVQAGHAVPSQFYTVVSPTGVRHDPPKGRCWIYNEERMKREIAEGNIWFGKDGSNSPRVKKFLRDAKIGLTPETIWLADEVGTSDSAKKQLMDMFPDKENVFETPKPEELLKRVIEIASDEGDYVLDCYIGSGTTMAVAHKLNRHYIGIEMGKQMSELVVRRMNMVIEGKKSGISETIGWQGGGHFAFYDFDKVKVQPSVDYSIKSVFPTNSFERLRIAAAQQLDFFDLFQCETDSAIVKDMVCEGSIEQDTLRQKALDLLSDKNIRDIDNKYCFFSLQLKPIKIDTSKEVYDSHLDRMSNLFEQKYFRKLLGKAFRPFAEEEFLYLSLDKDAEFYDDNMKLLSELSQDFNIREYVLGTNPREPINRFYQLLRPVIAKSGIILNDNGNEETSLKFCDFSDEVFLIGGYRSGDKNQLSWILDHAQYNLRYDERLKGRKEQVRNGVIHELNKKVVSARFLILYEIADESHTSYHIYRLGGYKVRTDKWMRKQNYERPSGQYLVYDIIKEEKFEAALLDKMIDWGRLEEMERLRKNNPAALTGDWEEKWKGSPIFMKGEDIDEYALDIKKNHNNMNN